MIVPLLEQMDYDGVMQKLMDFYIAAPYPPALSGNAVFPPKVDPYVEKMERWKRKRLKYRKR